MPRYTQDSRERVRDAVDFEELVGRTIHADQFASCDATALIEMARRQLAARLTPDDMVADDPESQRIMSLARKMADTEATVLITGESGLGADRSQGKPLHRFHHVGAGSRGLAIGGASRVWISPAIPD